MLLSVRVSASRFIMHTGGPIRPKQAHLEHSNVLIPVLLCSSVRHVGVIEVWKPVAELHGDSEDNREKVTFWNLCIRTCCQRQDYLPDLAVE